MSETTQEVAPQAKTLDELADHVYHSVAKFMGNCLQNPDFSGFNIVEKSDDKGAKCLVIVAAEKVGEIAVLRDYEPMADLQS